MINIAIICEYNPFHNGHEYQIQKIRDIFGENANIICLMSGNFVQRGDFAIFDKHTRAKMAVLGGSDLVLELPVQYAISSAEFFARGSISILNNLNCIDYLCFGSECGDISTLIDISNILISSNFQEKLKLELKNGISYPKSLDLALSTYNEKYSEIIKNPNNTLGIEYIKAIISSKSAIKPITITRKNVEHHATEEIENIASASYIRKNIQNDISHLTPCFEEISDKQPNLMITCENAILSYLKRKTTDDFLKIRDVSEGLEHKIVTELKKSTSLQDLISNIKSKRYTESRIRRIILNSYLDITKDFTEFEPKYAKVLSFSENGRKIIKSCKESSKIPLIIKPTLDYNLCEIGKKQELLDETTTDLYFMSYTDTSKRISGNEKRISPIYIEKSTQN